MEIKTEQLNFDLGMVAQKAQEQLKEALAYLLEKGKSLETVRFKNDGDNLVRIIKINPDLSFKVKNYDDDDFDDSFDVSVDSIDVYEIIDLLNYIKFNVIK